MDWIHRTGGTIIYFLFLLVLYPAGCRIADALGGRAPHLEGVHPRECGRSSGARAALLPLLCYLTIAIGIPLANGAWHNNAPKFAEHCTQVMSVCLIILATYFAAIFVYRRFSGKGRRHIELS